MLSISPLLLKVNYLGAACVLSASFVNVDKEPITFWLDPLLKPSLYAKSRSFGPCQ